MGHWGSDQEILVGVIADLAPKLQWEGSGEGTALFGGGEAVFSDKEHGDGDEISVVLS